MLILPAGGVFFWFLDLSSELTFTSGFSLFCLPWLAGLTWEAGLLATGESFCAEDLYGAGDLFSGFLEEVPLLCKVVKDDIYDWKQK